MGVVLKRNKNVDGKGNLRVCMKVAEIKACAICKLSFALFDLTVKSIDGPERRIKLLFFRLGEYIYF